MPDPKRRPRAAPPRRDVYTEADGLFGRLTDLVIENPARSGGLVMIVMVAGAIVSNAAFFQTAHHPDPFFATRPAQVVLPTTPAADAAPLPKIRPAIANPPAPAAVAAADPSLVADTQKALQGAGLYAGPLDGRLGPQTRAAISAFEMKAGLIPTGQPTEKLLLQMRKGTPHAAAVPTPNPVPDPVSTGSVDATAMARLKRVQTALNDIGYGPVPTDGRDGVKTATAIRRFELDNGLALTGQAGDTVIAKLVMIGAMKSP